MRRFACLLIVTTALAGCGDNLNPAGTPDARRSPDAPSADAAPPDAGPPDANLMAMRGATMSINDATVVDPEAAAVGGLRGGSVTIDFTDLTAGGGTPVFGTSPIGGCLVTQYDATHPPHTSLDAGAVTIANDTGNGLLKTVGPCAFVASVNGYRCISHTGTGVTIAATPQTAPVVVYAIPSATFPSTPAMIGSYLVVNGFTDTNLNSGASAFPVVAQGGTTALAVVNPAATATETTTAGAYIVFNGLQPVPGAGAAADFLGDGVVHVTKAATAEWGAIDELVDVPGDGFALDAGSSDPANLPLTTAADLNFSCDNDTPADATDDTCGAESTTALKAIILSGRATKRSVAALAPFQMPTEVPGSAQPWLEFQCAYLLTKSADMPAQAVQSIIDFAPTRVEMRVLYVAGNLLNGPNPGDAQTGRLLVGHALAGHTDP